LTGCSTAATSDNERLLSEAPAGGEHLAMKYAVVTFGCRVNQADSLSFEEGLMERGAEPSTPDEADLVVVNTCSVTGAADQGARQAIRRIARSNPSARIVVTGCYATRRPDEVQALPRVALVRSNDRKADLVAEILEGSTADRFGDGDGCCGARIEPGVAGRTAFTLRVQTGCDERCSYCIIPSTRGVSRSVPVDELLREIDRVASAGFKEIALTGVHLGSYGRDLSPATSLFELLRTLSTFPIRVGPHPHVLAEASLSLGLERRLSASGVSFRISSLEPMDCTPGIVDLVAARDCLAPHFHLPLQHASNRLLASMRRPYTIEQYADLVNDIRRRMPHAAIGSDIIVGFPGERDSDVEQLVDYLESSPLTHLHVFPYSDRPGTEAASMTGKVAGDAVRERARWIREVSARVAKRFRMRQIGSVHPALTIDDGSVVVTGNYLRLRIPPGTRRNEWVAVRVLSEDAGELLGGGPALTLHDQLTAGGADVAPAALAD
jgi:threonylcarbamoyladenosine tRNA methylthiotransferase MtaB